jgi:tetratricopeptide (TPR) repeat protein
VGCFFFALALMAKPLAITLPFLLLLFDVWPLERLSLPGLSPPEPGRMLPQSSLGRLLGEKLVLVLMSIASAVVTMYAQGRGGATEALSEVPLRFRVGNAIYSYARYLYKGVWPARLAAYYPHPEMSLAWWKVAVAGAVLLLMTALIWQSRKKRFLAAGWLWYAAALVPMAGFVQVGRQAIADRYAYLPMLGIFIIVVWLAADLTERSTSLRRTALAVSAVAICAFAWRTHQEIGYWRNTESLFTRSIEITGPNYIAEDHLAWSFDISGHPDLALPHALAAVHMAPENGIIHSRIADVFFHLGRFDEAIDEYRNALAARQHPASELWLRTQLGLALMQKNRLDEASNEFSLAIRLDSGKPAAYLNRGMIEYQQGRLDAAAGDFTRSLQIEPNPAAYYWMGRTMEDKHDLRAAAIAYQYSLRGGPEIADVRARLAAVQARLAP